MGVEKGVEYRDERGEGRGVHIGMGGEKGEEYRDGRG
jgi:hypothetical protein